MRNTRRRNLRYFEWRIRSVQPLILSIRRSSMERHKNLAVFFLLSNSLHNELKFHYSQEKQKLFGWDSNKAKIKRRNLTAASKANALLIMGWPTSTLVEITTKWKFENKTLWMNYRPSHQTKHELGLRTFR